MKDDPSDPDHVPSIFCYTPVAKKQETALQKKVERHQRVSERNHNKQRSLAASALLDVAKDDENTVPGFGVQTDPVHVE